VFSQGVQLKHSEKRILEDVLEMGGGYVLNFSDRISCDESGVADFEKLHSRTVASMSLANPVGSAAATSGAIL
jgi:hypothetical protein